MLLGIVIVVRFEHPEKASLPIPMTLLGIIVDLHAVISVFVDVSIIALQLSLLSYTTFPSSTVIFVKKTTQCVRTCEF